MRFRYSYSTYDQAAEPTSLRSRRHGGNHRPDSALAGCRRGVHGASIRLSCSARVERVIVFPMAISPNLWGLWNVVFVRLLRNRLPIGLWGAILPFVLTPLDLTVAGLLHIEFMTRALECSPEYRSIDRPRRAKGHSAISRPRNRFVNSCRIRRLAFGAQLRRSEYNCERIDEDPTGRKRRGPCCWMRFILMIFALTLGSCSTRWWPGHRPAPGLLKASTWRSF